MGWLDDPAGEEHGMSEYLLDLSRDHVVLLALQAVAGVPIEVPRRANQIVEPVGRLRIGDEAHSQNIAILLVAPPFPARRLSLPGPPRPQPLRMNTPASAVATRRGVKRMRKTGIEFWRPGMRQVFPASIARMPASATARLFIMLIRW